MRAHARGRGFDVIILGGGLDGRTAVLHCARRGLKALLLEDAEPQVIVAAGQTDDPSPVDMRRQVETLDSVVANDLWPKSITRTGSSWHVSTRLGTFYGAFLVNAAGRRAAEIAEQLGDPVPHRMAALLCMIAAPIDLPGPTPTPIPDSDVLLRQLDDGRVLIRREISADTNEPPDVSAPDLLALASTARILCEHMPVLRGAEIFRVWTEHELRFHDDQPIVGPSEIVQGLFHLIGFRNTAAVLTGAAKLAEWIASGVGGPDANS